MTRLRVLSCCRTREMRREPKVPEEKVTVVECFDCLTRITSKELAPIHSVISGILQNACSTRPRVVDEQPGKRSKKKGDKSAVTMLKSTRQLGCHIKIWNREVFIDFAEKLKHTETNPMCQIH